MISEEIEFFGPDSLSDALEVLASREDVVILSGGMSLLPMMNVGLATPSIVLSLNHVSELDYVRESDTALHIGALTRHATVATNELIRQHCPSLSDAAGHIGDVQVRNRGTIGGSVAHADASADYLPVLSLAGAMVNLSSARGSRSLPLTEFLVDMFLTARESHEALTEVVVPKKSASSVDGYVRFSRVEGSFPIINVAARIDEAGTSGSLAIGGGVGPRPVVLDITPLLEDGVDEGALDRVGDAAYAATDRAISDTSADSEYRREMARVFSRRAVRAAQQPDP